MHHIRVRELILLLIVFFTARTLSYNRFCCTAMSEKKNDIDKEIDSSDETVSLCKINVCTLQNVCFFCSSRQHGRPWLMARVITNGE